MGSSIGLYNPDFPKGSKVRIASRAFLEDFARPWQCHHPLHQEQLEFGEVEAVVEEVSFYHGGDELYRLSGVPGIWHEPCLRQAGTAITAGVEYLDGNAFEPFARLCRTNL